MRLVGVVLAGIAVLCLVPAVAVSQNFSVEETLASLGKGPTLGSANAPVAIVEFSDFQCSFCKKFWRDTLPKLKNNYIEKGQVKFIFRHFAILGNHSVQAAQGAECAGEQGKFWEYHDKLFTNQGSLAFTDVKLKHYARELGLKSPPFSQCFGSGKFVRKIEGEASVAAILGVRGTPAFFVNGRLLVGAQPFEVFSAAISEELKRNGSNKR